MAGTIKVVDLLAQAQILLLDTAGTRWALTELQGWLNSGYRAIVDIRPDANTPVGTVTCIAGIRQDVASTFANAIELVEVIRNVAATSNNNMVIQIDRHSLDDQRRTWPNDPASVNIENYIYDPRTPTQFLVYPPALNTAQLEVVYNAIPTPHTLTLVQLQNTSTSETIRLIDSYANPLLDFVMYRAFTKDSDNPANARRAADHYQAFKDAMGLKAGGDKSVQPGNA
jgi:hypothetical protein